MKYFFKVYGVYHGANDHLSNELIYYQTAFYYLAIDMISAICGNRVTMVNGDFFCLDDYNMDKLKEFMYHHEFRFIDNLGHEWRPSQSMTTVR